MYEKHFGLKSRPFGSKAEGASVFVGPQQSKAIASLQKGIGAPDAVVTVSGAVGIGKTTLVNRALETLPTGRTAARIGRMHLSQQEVIDLLMAGFGIKQSHQGSIRRFAAFRRLLQAQSESGIPVAIVIEDAQRLGIEALAEVEALTAADAGDAAANIILMGQANLHDLLSTPDLARLKQRIRLRQEVTPLSHAEVQGYLKHSIREAGGNYDDIFDSGVVEIVHGCSEGVPRMINTLCETALATAMDDHSARVTTALMRQVALDTFGYRAAAEDADMAAVVLPRSETAVEPSAIPATDRSADEDIDWEAPQHQLAEQAPVIGESRIGHDMIVESGSYTSAAAIRAEEPASAAECNVLDIAPEDTNRYAIPELINDTQPELPELKPPVLDDPADIPVLRPNFDITRERAKPAVDGGTDIESTQTLAQPVGLLIDEAVPPAPHNQSSGLNDAPDDEASEADFDLDAALSPDVDETNVMPGITPDLDILGKESPRAEAEIPAPDQRPEAKPGAAARVFAPPAEPEAKPTAKPLSSTILEENDLPTLSNEMRVGARKEVARADALVTETPPTPELIPPPDAPTDAPAMRDPSLHSTDADPKSDIEALEEALAAAKNGSMPGQDVMPAKTRANGGAPELAVDDLPEPESEITLDHVIANQQLQNDQLDRFRAEIGSASSLEDISDVMAETLFGCDAFDEIAAAVVANPPPDHGPQIDDNAISPVRLTDKEIPKAANDPTESGPEKTAKKASPPPMSDKNGNIRLNESTALRIEMLNQMKTRAAAMAENVELGEDIPSGNSPQTRGPQPEPIESQINTSITQTLEALKLSTIAEHVVEEKPEKKSGGLFSRFKKSS